MNCKSVEIVLKFVMEMFLKISRSTLKAEKGDGKLKAQGYTLIELLAVIAIIGVLGAIFIPAVISVRKSAAQATAVGNLRSLTVAGLLNAAENNGFLPNTDWPGEAKPFGNANADRTVYRFDAIKPFLYTGAGLGDPDLIDGTFRAPFLRGHNNHGNDLTTAAWSRIDFVNVYAWLDPETLRWSQMNAHRASNPGKMPFLITGHNDGTAGLTSKASFNRWVYHPNGGGASPSQSQLPEGTAFVYSDQIFVGYADGRVVGVPFTGSASTFNTVFGRG